MCMASIASYTCVHKGDSLLALYTRAGDAFDMPMWSLRLILCGVLVPTVGIIDGDWMSELQDATVVHVVCKRKVAIRLTDESYMDIPLPSSPSSVPY